MTDTTNKTAEALAALLDEVRQCFTRDDDLPGNLLHRIDEALAAQPQAEVVPEGLQAVPVIAYLHHDSAFSWAGQRVDVSSAKRMVLLEDVEAALSARPPMAPPAPAARREPGWNGPMVNDAAPQAEPVAAQPTGRSVDVAQVVYALERAERRLQGEADALQAQHDYGAEFPAEDAERMREAVALLRSLAAQPQAEPVAANGFVLVPVKLTPEIRAVFERCERDRDLTVEEAWAAMLAARPPVAQTQQGAVERLKFDIRQGMIEYGSALRDGNEEGIRETTTRTCDLLDRLGALAATTLNAKAASAQSVRDAFEAWAAELEYDLRPMCDLRPDFGDTYISPSTENAWRCWSAALASPQPAAAQPVAQGLTDDERNTIQGAINELPYAHPLIPRLTAMLTAHPAQADEGDTKASADEGGV
jgi:hypothetical protein